MPPRDDMDLYEQDSFDQDPRESDDSKEDKKEYKSFLAPKDSFPDEAKKVGSVHKVRTERALDAELELKCVEHDDDENDDELYD